MDQIRIEGGQRLEGRIPISGAKNAALPLMCASLLTDESLVLRNLPRLSDISSMAHLLGSMGISFSILGDDEPHQGHMGRVISLDGKKLTSTRADYEIVRKMRASILVLGPLMARMGEATVSLPGGCAIGPRPVDLHIKGLEAMGAEIDLRDGYIHAKAPGGRLKGGIIDFDKVTVTGTENLLMAAVLAEGRTIIKNAAQEPEVTDLVICLKAMGAQISGEGTDTLTIDGVERLHGATHDIIPDRIEAGTFMVAAAITSGDLFLEGARLEDQPAFTEILQKSGVTLEQHPDGVRAAANLKDIKGIDLVTEPYPGVATDLQAQYMTLMTLAQTPCTIDETIFENRMMHVPELSRLGANIDVDGNTARINPVSSLKGAEVMATDLRASVSLVLAGLAAEGVTTVNRIYHLDRGYERIEEKLRRVGAKIQRVSSETTPKAGNTLRQVGT